MEKIYFSITINATKEKVWKVLFSSEFYTKWTTPFCPGSYAVTDWMQGSKALFLSPDNNGIVSRIKTSRPNEFLSIEHLGMVKNGMEDYESEVAKKWAGVHENYTLTDDQSITLLEVDMDISNEYKNYFDKTWPAAMQLVKELAEKI